MNKDTEDTTTTPLEPVAEEQQNKGQADSEQPQENTDHQDTEKVTAVCASSIDLKWNVIGNSQYEFQRISGDAIVQGSTVYMRDSLSREDIYAYDFVRDSWSKVSMAPFLGTLVLVNNLITSVGGGTNKLFSCTGKGESQKWTEKFPPMPTARHGVSAMCTKATLIVAGGDDSKKVEVMNTETHQWSTAASLPVKLRWSSMTVCGDQIYMMGGSQPTFLEGYRDTNSVYTCSLSALLEEKSLAAKLASALSLSKVWNRVADLPVAKSTGVCLNGQLLAIGGSAANAATVAVRMYDPTMDKWKIISHMSQPRHSCFAAVLPDNTLLVLAGRGPQDCIGYIQEVEKATIV